MVELARDNPDAGAAAPPGPQPGGPRAAAGPVERLGVHHEDRHDGRVRARSARSVHVLNFNHLYDQIKTTTSTSPGWPRSNGGTTCSRTSIIGCMRETLAARTSCEAASGGADARPFRRQARRHARRVLRQALPAGRLARRHRHLQADHVGGRARHRPGPGRLRADHAHAACPSRAPTTSSSWPATRPCSPSGSTARCSAADIELARRWFAEHSATRGVPARAVGRDPGRASRATTFTCPSTSGASPAGRRSCRACRACSSRGMGGADLVPRAGHVPLLRPGHPGDQGPADEAGHAARRRVRPARRPRRGVQPRPAAGPLRRRPAAGSPPTTPPSSSIRSCSSRSAPSATR